MGATTPAFANLFVTGTDTGIGKTLVACALLRSFAVSGLRAVGMKPVATGCRADAPDRANEDIAMLVAASNIRAPVELINPYCFAPPIAPHLAAQQAGTVISLERIGECYRSLAGLADRVVVEGGQKVRPGQIVRPIEEGARAQSNATSPRAQAPAQTKPANGNAPTAQAAAPNAAVSRPSVPTSGGSGTPAR